MKVRETFYSMKCDCCGQMLDDENYYPENELGTIADECGTIEVVDEMKELELEKKRLEEEDEE